MLNRLHVLLVAGLLATPAAAQTPSPASGDAGLAVTVSGDLVSLRASGVPVSTVLERIAEVTGIKVSFTDTRPQDPVTLVLRNVTTRQAVTQVLDGLGIDYAVGLSPDRSRIRTLVVTGAGLRESAAGATSPSTVEPSEPGGRAADAQALTVPQGRVEQSSEETDRKDGEDSEERRAEFGPEPPRPPGVELPNETHPPLPTRPADLPTSPFEPYYGSLNPDGPPPDPNAPLIEFPSPGDIVDMDGMGPNGVPTTERKGRLPEVTPAPGSAPAPSNPPPPPSPPSQKPEKP